MSARKTVPRLTLAALAAAALAAPAAAAMQAEGFKMDMHASTVTTPEPAAQDRRGEAAADSSPAPRVRPQTWPAYPRAIPPSVPTEAAPVGDGNGGGSDVPVLVLLLGGAVALAGGAVVLTRRTRERTAH
jgi:hypothetical protein